MFSLLLHWQVEEGDGVGEKIAWGVQCISLLKHFPDLYSLDTSGINGTVTIKCICSLHGRYGGLNNNDPYRLIHLNA